SIDQELAVSHYDHQEKNKWFEYLFTQTDYKNIPAERKQFIYDSPVFTASFGISGNIRIQLSSYSRDAFTKEENNILIRFAKVFEQAHTRFLDLQKAEAQAREAQIEAALEKVRSSSLAMHQSEDIQHVVHELYTRLLELNIRLDSANILFFKEGSRDIECWTGSNIMKYQQATLPYADHDFLKDQNEAHENGSELFKSWYSKEKKDALFKYFFEETELKLVPEDRKKFVFSGYHHACSTALVQHVGVNLNRYFEEPFSAEEDSILKRFARVFHQAYTRFLDLQKAEAQARESQIQLALERVRARTMAMQKSDELPETTFLLFQQVKELSETALQLSIGIIKEEQGVVELSATVHGNPLLQTYNVPANEPYIMKKAVKAWKEKRNSLRVEIEGEELKAYNNWRNSVLEKKINFPEDKWIVNIIFFSKGLISFSSDREITKETVQLLERFAAVFDLTYTRFQDLKQVEEQAREAQIELALERVRARTMAMQKSDELHDVAAILFKQVNELGIKPWTSGFKVWTDDNDFCTDYVTNPEGGFMESYHIDMTQSPVFLDISNAKKRGDEFFVNHEEGEQLAETYRQLSKYGPKQFEAISHSGFQFPFEQYEHHVFGSKVSLMFITYQPVPEAHDTFKRFGKVFEQTYTRFLDLQKAEAQARESRIQLALERVRARTMAMQKSEELNEVAELLFKQVSDLGIKAWTTGFNIWSDDNNSFTDYITSPQGGFIEPYTVDAPLSILRDARKRKEEFLVFYLEGEILKETYRQL
ncbi:MAG: hypothetical protein ACJ749_12285, partial [Flavisolibacter sp.]